MTKTRVAKLGSRWFGAAGRSGGRRYRGYIHESNPKASWFYVLVLLFGILILGGASRAAESKPSWQIEWDKIVAAAKKEGRLNFYVGRYGSEKLLNEFRKEFPEIKKVGSNGAGTHWERASYPKRAPGTCWRISTAEFAVDFRNCRRGATPETLESHHFWMNFYPPLAASQHGIPL
jgi:hypothetical protein